MPKKSFVDFRNTHPRIIIEQVLEHYGLLGQFKLAGKFLVGCCPLHGGDNARQFWIDIKSGSWSCTGTCHSQGNLADFIKQIKVANPMASK